MTAEIVADRRLPTLKEALPTWTRIALLSFGGPAGQIAVMHRILVDEKRWIGERRFLHALNYCMLLPGPEAQQLATYIGWLMHRTAGGLIAGALFVLPGFVSIMALSVVYALYGDVGPIGGLFFGLKSAVLVIVVQAVIRVGKRSLRSRTLIALAALAFVALFFFRTPFPLVIVASGVIGLAGSVAGWTAFKGGGHGSMAPDALGDADSLLGEETPRHCRPNLRWSLSICGVLAVLWLAPVALCGVLLGWDNVFSQIGIFFSKMAVVTFGGAYAVLSYVAQEAVQTYGWLRPGEMLDGLGMAETTPGPLIIVTQFVGFLAAMRKVSGLDPMLAAVLGGVLTTWVTFVPCFLWIFLGAPFVEMLRGARVINAALAAISAAVVGVILNLAVWLGLHDLFTEMRPARFGLLALDIPVFGSLDVASAVLTAGAAVAAFRFKVGLFPLLAGCAIVGIALRTVA